MTTSPATSMTTGASATSGLPPSTTGSKLAATASPKKRESKGAKADRYLLEGRLTVTRVDGDVVEAECRGNGAVYAVGFSNGHWTCDCPAYSDCCHRMALQRVTVRPR